MAVVGIVTVLQENSGSAAAGVTRPTLSSVPCKRLCEHQPGEPRLPPRIDLAWTPTLPHIGEPVHLTATSVGVAAGALSWAVDGRGLANTRGSLALVVFHTAGPHVVVVQARTREARLPAQPTATVRITVSLPTPPPGCPETLPFNVLSGARDPNGLPLNPEWGWQCEYRPSAGPFAPLTSPIGRDFPAPEDPSRSRVSEYPDPYELCNKFSYGNGEQTQLDTGPKCSSQISEVDAAQLDTWGWYEICHLKPSFPFWEEDEYVHGHVNFLPVTYTGRMQVEGFGGLGNDGDTNFKLYPDPSTAPQLGIPTTPGLTPANVESGPEPAFEEASLHVEYASPEISPALGDWYETWQKLLKAASYVAGEQQGTAVITGLLGLDDRHEAKAELHPVYAFAVREKPRSDSADRWLVMFRNWGNEGGCSTHDALRHQLRTAGGRITLALPSPNGMANAVRLGHENLKGSNVAGEAQAPIVSALSPDHRHADVTVTLPEPSDRPVLAGEITLNWSGFTRRQLQSEFAMAAPLPGQRPLPRRQAGETPEEEPDTLLVRVTKLLSPDERRRLEALLHGRPIATAPEAACQVFGPAAARARRERRDTKEVEIVQVVLRCPTGA